MNWFGKNVSKVTRLEPSESVITPQQTAGIVRISRQVCRSKSFICIPGFFFHKMLHILPTKVRNEQREQHFSWVKMIRATIKVIPWRETHVIQTRNYDRLQKIIMVFLAAQCSKLKKKLVLILNFTCPHAITYTNAFYRWPPVSFRRGLLKLSGK